MNATARLLVLGYGTMLCAVGLAGILSASWELRAVFALDLTTMPDPARATLLNQYRFLKAVELGAGIFCLGLCRRILTNGVERRLFLALVAAGIAARMLAWAVDGRPGTAFIVFLVLEIGVLAVVTLQQGRRE